MLPPLFIGTFMPQKHVKQYLCECFMLILCTTTKTTPLSLSFPSPDYCCPAEYLPEASLSRKYSPSGPKQIGRAPLYPSPRKVGRHNPAPYPLTTNRKDHGELSSPLYLPASISLHHLSASQHQPRKRRPMIAPCAPSIPPIFQSASSSQLPLLPHISYCRQWGRSQIDQR